MRTLTKNRGIITATVALLMLSAMLFTGCDGNVNAVKPYTPPTGMGAVKLNFNRYVRSIVPGTNINDFDHFVLSFEDENAGTHSFEKTITSSDFGEYFNLVPATYDLTIIGFLGPANTTDAAIYEETGISVDSGHVITLNVTLTPYVPESGKEGTFTWSITDNTENDDGDSILETASMIITPIPSGAPKTITLFDSLVPTNNLEDLVGETLDAGYYFVDFSFEVDGYPANATVNFRHVLHIYKNMTSYFEYTLTNNYFDILSTSYTPNLDFSVKDYYPALTVEYDDSGLSVPLTGNVTVNSTTAKAVIVVSNFADALTVEPGTPIPYDHLEWYCGSTTPLSTEVSGTNGEILTINYDSDSFLKPSFNNDKTYKVTVIGYGTDDALYATTFNVIVEK